MKKNSGVSMLILIVTILVILILMATVSLRINVYSGREKISTLANNLYVIEEYIKSCEILKEELPFEALDLSLESVKALIDEEKLDFFENELDNNGDSSTTKFKKIDVKKIGVKKEFTGYGEKGENDIYIYSENTGIVYYLVGIPYNGSIYFSISDKITSFIK